MVTQTVPTELAHTAGDDTYPLVASIPTASRKRRSRATITLLVLVLVLFGGAGALGTLYFRAQSRLDLTTHEVSTTKNTLTDVQGQLTQANADNRTLTTQKTNLNTQIGLMTPCARSAKALADILDTDLKTNVNPFLDNKIVGPMSEEIGYCR
ncbi:hypothetical protein EV192_10120 [Actinocrispum wychmicini]|uniref:Uncharacterized protein n=1 Tax=Actinocrispum wychmicini TaxID=1213861 RepID=A0A4R2K383_9PSEU|nr:hypothetical protein EV192_10120 [Actinocrispum wychmicini]